MVNNNKGQNGNNGNGVPQFGLFQPLYTLFVAPAKALNEAIFGKAEEPAPDPSVTPEMVDPYATWHEQVLAQKTASQAAHMSLTGKTLFF